MSERTKGQLLVENKRLRAEVERLDRIVNPMAVAIVTHAKRKIWYSRRRVNLCPRQGAGDSRSVCTGCRGKTPTEPIYFESRCRSRRGRGGHLAQTTSIQQTLSSTRGKVRECVEPSRAGHTGVRCADVVACLLASPTDFCADATVFVMGSVPFALLGTGEARRGAGLDDCPDHR
jgi:hypothetical protein